jgi:hypothetical protein
MNHKRKRQKNRRGGCLFCKPHKINGCSHDKSMRFGALRRYESGREQMRCEGLKAE